MHAQPDTTIPPLPGWPTEPAYLPAGHPDAPPAAVPQLGPGMGWGIAADGTRVPVYLPAPTVSPQPYDPLPQRLYGYGVVMAGGGVLAIGVGIGSWFFFRGMALAVDSIVGVAVVAGAFVFLKAASGVRIGDVTMGDGANFQVGRQR